MLSYIEVGLPARSTAACTGRLVRRRRALAGGARRIRSRPVDVNGGAWNPVPPSGGYKTFVLGRELVEAELEEYLEVKAVQRRTCRLRQ